MTGVIANRLHKGKIEDAFIIAKIKQIRPV
jgi:hypothetical protein